MTPVDLAARIGIARAAGALLAGPPAGLTLAEGYAVQDMLTLGERAGWKVGATSAGAQAFLGVSEPIRGRVVRAGVHRGSDITVTLGERLECEPEIVVEVGANDRIMAAWFGAEVVRPSVEDPFPLGAGFIVADNAAHVALMIGPGIALHDLDDPAALSVSMTRDGAAAGDGTAAAVLGDPRRAVGWLAKRVALQPGDLIATGAMARAMRCPPGTMLSFDCGRWGSWTARFG